MANAASAAGGSWTVMQQLGVQIAAVAIAMVCAAVGTFVIVLVVEKTIGFRANEVHEMAGLDRICHGEYGYGMLNPARCRPTSTVVRKLCRISFPRSA